MQVKLTNNTTKFSVYYPEVEVKMDNSLYATVLVNTRDLQDGEYTMELYSDKNTLIVEDIVKIGDYTKQQKIEYKIEKKFTQYVKNK